MRIRDLKECLAKIPEDAIVFIECDHGQQLEEAYNITMSRSEVTEKHPDPDSMIFEYDNWREVYDEESIEEYDENGKVTAVLISY